MNEKQVKLIHWMYNLLKVEMIANAHGNFKQGDIDLFTESINRRFPEHADEIIKPFDGMPEVK